MFRKKRRSHKKRGLYSRMQHMVSIHDRPKVSAGTWETDLVVSSRSGIGALSTSNEKVSRYSVVDYVPDRTASCKQKTLQRLTESFQVKSITFNRGHENASHYKPNFVTPTRVISVVLMRIRTNYYVDGFLKVLTSQR